MLLEQSLTITFFIKLFNNDVGIGNDIGFQFLRSLALLQYVIFVVMIIFYPVYPSIFSIRKHLSKRNPKSALTEYQALKKIVYALLPLSFFTVALNISSIFTQDNPLIALVLYLPEPWQSYFLSVLAAILFTFTSALLRIILLNMNKRFKFYLARLSFRILSRMEDEVERMKYLIGGLSFYNKYIKRTLGLEINDLKIIYSKIIADTATVDKNHSIKELCRAFEDDDNKLRPVRCLTGLFDVGDPAHFLVKESLGKKIVERAAFIGTLISTIAAVTAILLNLSALL